MNSTILNDKIWLIFISQAIFKIIYWLVFMKKIFMLLFDQLETDGSKNIESFSGGL